MMQKETLNLQLSLKRFSDEDLSSIKSEDLDELEQQLECSVNKVRARKIEFLQQEMDNLEMKMKENEAALMEHHQQVAMVPNTSEEQRSVLDQFPFSGKSNPAVSFSWRPCLQFLTHIYHLLPAQPNLQDFSLQHPNYGGLIHHNRL
ncbi:hypothetical protein SLA2020_413760 [Shorea laevis]